MFFRKSSCGWIRFLPMVFIMACASPKSPTGGPKDESPPAIIEAASTPNHQTQFQEKVITITFDEWITLKDVYRQLVVSPLMPKDPDIRQKGRSIIITLPDSLKEETTYTLHFGNAIQDLNEGNVLENYAFVFSTGMVLDSIRLTGQVTDALLLKPAEGVWVMLHPAGVDSAVYKQKPEYLAKTNREGKWSIANIRSDSFSVVALKDENLNFLYDQETELFGWLEETVHTRNPTEVLPEIKVFPKEKKITIREILHPAPGWIKIIVDAPLPKPIPSFIPPIEQSAMEWDGDTLHVWYPPADNYSGSAVLLEDTTRIRISSARSLLSSDIRLLQKTGRLHPSAKARFSAEIPLASMDTARIKLIHDSLGMLPYVITTDSLRQREIEVSASWIESSRYSLTFMPGAVTDIWGRTHDDTIRQSIVVNSPDQFGDLILDVDGLDSTRQYVVSLKAGEQILDRFVIDRQERIQVKKRAMSPGKYTIEVIDDANGNTYWDTGDYQKRRQPEKKLIFVLDNLRAGWDLEAKIVWK